MSQESKAKRSRQSPVSRILSWVGYGIVCLFALGFGVAGGLISKSKVLREGLGHLNEPPQEVFHADTLNLLILGCDDDLATGGKTTLRAGARSDMMLLARIDFIKKKLTGVSIPRDIYFGWDGYPTKHKMNAFHEFGGDPLSKEAVENLLGVKVDRVIDIDFRAFQKMVDLVGGVPITVDKDLKYTDRAGGLFINIKKGPQVLNGYDAMGFVRFRHSDSDFARQERQHEFILAFKKVLQKHLDLIPKLADLSVELLSNQFTDLEAFKLAQFSAGLKDKSIEFGQVPAIERPHTTALKLDEDHVDDVLARYGFKNPASQETP